MWLPSWATWTLSSFCCRTEPLQMSLTLWVWLGSDNHREKGWDIQSGCVWACVCVIGAQRRASETTFCNLTFGTFLNTESRCREINRSWVLTWLRLPGADEGNIHLMQIGKQNMFLKLPWGWVWLNTHLRSLAVRKLRQESCESEAALTVCFKHTHTSEKEWRVTCIIVFRVHPSLLECNVFQVISIREAP